MSTNTATPVSPVAPSALTAPPSTTWFLVHGRPWGADDDTVEAYAAENAPDAVEQFCDANGIDLTTEGRGGGFIISVWSTGMTKPEQVR
jgi:hypothetical protein